MTREAVLVFDLGTTTTKAALADPDTLSFIATASRPSPIRYPREGWAEQDSEELWGLLSSLSQELLEDARGTRVRAIAFSTYLAGVVLLDGDGEAVTPIITWLDERAAGLPREVFAGPIRVAGYNAFRLLEFLRITGGAPSKTGKDPISKMVWLRENLPDIWRSAAGIGNLKSWLLARTTGVHATSVDEAHLTWLADTRGGRASWCRRLLSRYGIPIEKMPRIMWSTEVAGTLRGEAASDLGVEPGIPVVVGLGDMASVAVGVGAVEPGRYHVYIGTSDWVGVHSRRRLLDVSHYIGSLLSAEPGLYMVVAEQEIGGGLLDWLLGVLGTDYSALEEAAEAPPGSEGVLAAPWLFGERCPVDDPNARGAIVGLGVRHGRAHLVRAALEGVALNMAWAFRYTAKLAGPPRGPVRAAGGGMRSALWAEILASALGVPLEVVEDPPLAGLRGAAAMASAAVRGESLGETVSRIPIAARVEPRPDWSRVYSRLLPALEGLYKGLRSTFRRLAHVTPQ